MDKTERFNYAYEHLKSLGIVHKQKDIADTMGVSAPNISNAFKGNPKYLTDRFLKRFNDAFGGLFNCDWLMVGEGEMLREPVPITIAEEEKGMSFGKGLIESMKLGAKVGYANAATNGLFGSLIGGLFGINNDISDDEAAEILREALEDHKRLSQENEELKNEVEYWRSKANNLEYQLSKTKAG